MLPAQAPAYCLIAIWGLCKGRRRGVGALPAAEMLQLYTSQAIDGAVATTEAAGTIFDCDPAVLLQGEQYASGLIVPRAKVYQSTLSICVSPLM